MFYRHDDKPNTAISILGVAALLAVLLFWALGLAEGAEQSQCQEWKIQAYFGAVDGKDGATMWSTLSPHAQSPWKNKEELQAFLDNTPEQRYEVEIYALPDSICNYHVLARVITTTETIKSTQAVLFHVEMDEYGIMGVYTERQWEPIIEKRVEA